MPRRILIILSAFCICFFVFSCKKKSDELLQKLAKLQTKNPVKTSPEEIAMLIREDRNR